MVIAHAQTEATETASEPESGTHKAAAPVAAPPRSLNWRGMAQNWAVWFADEVNKLDVAILLCEGEVSDEELTSQIKAMRQISGNLRENIAHLRSAGQQEDREDAAASQPSSVALTLAEIVGNIEDAMRTAHARLDGVTLALDNIEAENGGSVPEQEDTDTIIDGVRQARALVRCVEGDYLEQLRRALKGRAS